MRASSLDNELHCLCGGTSGGSVLRSGLITRFAGVLLYLFSLGGDGHWGSCWSHIVLWR